MGKRRVLAVNAAERGFSQEVAQVHQQYTPRKIRKPIMPCTEESYERARRFWRQYNLYIGRDEEYGLRPADRVTAMDIATYAEFLFKGTRGILNEYITYATLKKYLHDLEAALQRSGNEGITKDLMRDVIEEVKDRLLTTGLVPTNKREKILVNPPDFLEIMAFLWAEDSDSFTSPLKRLRLSFFIYAIAFAVTRPGGITLARGQTKMKSTLCYRDLELILIKIPNSQECMFLLKTKLNNHKRRRTDDSLFNNVVLHDSDVARPVSQFIALAFADDAFEAEQIKTPGDLLLVKPLAKFKRSSYTFKWKKECLDKPIFHTDGKAWNSANAGGYLKYLGRKIGFKNNLTAYNIRYGIANCLETNATLGQRNQLLGHLDNERMFDQNYRSETSLVDVQSVFLGTPKITNVIMQTTGHIRHRDTRAPQAPDQKQLKDVLSEDPLYQKACKEFQAAKKLLEEAHSNNSDLTTGLNEIKKEVTKASRTKAVIKKQHWRNLVSSDRQDFFANIDTWDINKQILGAQGKITTKSQPFRVFRSQSKPLSTVRQAIVERMNMKAEIIGIDTVLITKLLQYCKIRLSVERPIAPLLPPRAIQNTSTMSITLRFQRYGVDLPNRTLRRLINETERHYENVLASYSAWKDIPNDQKSEILATVSQSHRSKFIQRTKDNWMLEWLFCYFNKRKQKQLKKQIRKQKQLEEQNQKQSSNKQRKQGMKRKIVDETGPTPSKKQKNNVAPTADRSRILELPKLPTRTISGLWTKTPSKDIKSFLLANQFDEQTADDYLVTSRSVYEAVINEEGKGKLWKRIDEGLVTLAYATFKRRVLQPAHFDRAPGDWLVGFLLQHSHYVARQYSLAIQRNRWQNETA
ncbi:hypothetical protein TWF788_006167 [Orbilia oligospora]|uniref:Uncharacterized protein n=1 Tax=Orbilia oligospora TaxID=2813651 RepID=A0A7C8Q4W5_ORBOL|nr:hypothetical protein TWF788_006167 [Orbilia oligospora]